MLRFEAPSDYIIAAIKYDINSRKTQAEDATDDVIMSCRDGVARTNKNLLCTFSPLLRGIIDQQHSCNANVMLPQLRKEAVENALEILEMQWKESVILDNEAMELFSEKPGEVLDQGSQCCRNKQ